MSNKTPAVISTVLTIILLVIFSIISIFMEMVVLNGASEKQGMAALGISLVCNGLATILLGLFSGWFTNLAIAKFSWNKILAVIVAVVLGTGFGAVTSFLSIIISIPLAGIK